MGPTNSNFPARKATLFPGVCTLTFCFVVRGLDVGSGLAVVGLYVVLEVVVSENWVVVANVVGGLSWLKTSE